MIWQISRYEVSYLDAGRPRIALYAGKRVAATVRFGNVIQRFSVDPETMTVDIRLANSERMFFMDLLRNERGVAIDTDALTLVVRGS